MIAFLCPQTGSELQAWITIVLQWLALPGLALDGPAGPGWPGPATAVPQPRFRQPRPLSSLAPSSWFRARARVLADPV